MQKAAIGVMEAEWVTLARCIWLQDKPILVTLVGVSAVLFECEWAVDDAAAETMRLVSMPPGLSRQACAGSVADACAGSMASLSAFTIGAGLESPPRALAPVRPAMSALPS